VEKRLSSGKEENAEGALSFFSQKDIFTGVEDRKRIYRILGEKKKEETLPPLGKRHTPRGERGKKKKRVNRGLSGQKRKGRRKRYTSREGKKSSCRCDSSRGEGSERGLKKLSEKKKKKKKKGCLIT